MHREKVHHFPPSLGTLFQALLRVHLSGFYELLKSMHNIYIMSLNFLFVYSYDSDCREVRGALRTCM